MTKNKKLKRKPPNEAELIDWLEISGAEYKKEGRKIIAWHKHSFEIIITAGRSIIIAGGSFIIFALKFGYDVNKKEPGKFSSLTFVPLRKS